MQFDTKNYWLAKQSYYDINIYDDIYLSNKTTKRARRNIGLDHKKNNITFFCNAMGRTGDGNMANLTTTGILSNILALTLLTGKLAKPILASKSIAHLHIKKGMATGAIIRSLEPFWYLETEDTEIAKGHKNTFKVHENIWNSAKWLNTYSYFGSKRNIVLHCAAF